MPYRESDNEDGQDKVLEANMVPMSVHAQMRKAFRDWLDASKAWSTLRQASQANGDRSTAKRELRELERRLNAAADAFTQTQQQLSAGHRGSG